MTKYDQFSKTQRNLTVNSVPEAPTVGIHHNRYETQAKPTESDSEKKFIKPIKQYIRDTNGVKVGLLMAGRIDNKVAIGFCCLHENDYGKFDVDLADKIASGRAETYQTRIPKRIPPKIAGELSLFVSRCERYYKNYVLPEWIEKLGF